LQEIAQKRDTLKQEMLVAREAQLREKVSAAMTACDCVFWLTILRFCCFAITEGPHGGASAG
jgi:hypothetical protein